MNNKGYCHIPSALFEYITFLVRALPIRSIPTFIELLVGSMLTQTGTIKAGQGRGRTGSAGGKF